MRKGYKYLVGFLRTCVFPAFPPPSKTPRESWRRRQCIVTLPSRPAHDEPPPKLGFR